VVENTESVTSETYLNKYFLFTYANLKIKLFAFIAPCLTHARKFSRVARRHRPVPSRSSLSSRRASFLSRRSFRSISSLIRRASFASSLRQHAMMESSVMILDNNSQLRAYQQFHWKNICPNSNASVQSRWGKRKSPPVARWGENPNHIQCVTLTEILKRCELFYIIHKSHRSFGIITPLHVVFIFGGQSFFNTVRVPL